MKPPGATRRRLGQRQDVELKWVLTVCGPQMEAWRAFAQRWMATQTRAFDQRFAALRVFLEDYLHPHHLHDPVAFLRRGAKRPVWFGAACDHSRGGIRYNNDVRRFLAWVLENCEPFSEDVEGGQRVTLPGYVNPVSRMTFAACRYTESVRAPLPYKYIDELRTLLAPGENFGDWRWSQVGIGPSSMGDWFEVGERMIDETDPDCVWRRRIRNVHRRTPRSHYVVGRRAVVEMWSPVRSVLLMLKLTLPLRTFQARMLDSGEADTERCELRTHAGGVVLAWGDNPGPLKEGDARHPVQRGVFRKLVDPHSGEVNTGFFINTNKTADNYQQPDQRGYVMPWPHERMLRWLIKLRAWQEKYNPLDRPRRWTELEYRHIGHSKSPRELAAMPPTCFLFRDARAAKREDRARPTLDSAVESFWPCLLTELERRCAARGERLANGGPIRFIARRNRWSTSTFFPLHSLRVSLLTAPALDGGVPLPVLSKLVAGHSRLLMTIYYVKVGSARMSSILKEAEERIQANAAHSLTLFLQEKPYAELASVVAATDETTLRQAIGDNPAQRNAVGWAPVHLGMCLAGGNTSPVANLKTLGGCFNGGELMRAAKEPGMRVYAAVRGGARNCVACRWLVTEPQHLPRWVAHFNNVSYHLHERAASLRTLEEKRQRLQAMRYEAELAQRPFTDQAQLEETSRLHESAAAQVDALLADARDSLAMIARLQRLLKSPPGDAQQLVAAGQLADVRSALEDTDSELLQLAGVCEDAELYPDLPVGKAVVRRSQFLDRMLAREGRGAVFLALDESTQHAVGNRLLREMARAASPQNPMRGLREVTTAIESGAPLGWAAAIAERVLAESGTVEGRTTLLPSPKSPLALAQGSP